MIERRSGSAVRGVSELTSTDSAKEPEPKKRQTLTVIIAGAIMVASLMAGATLVSIELVDAFTATSIHPVSSP